MLHSRVPRTLSVEDVQKQLGADEALVLFLDTPEANPTPEATFIWVVTRTDMRARYCCKSHLWLLTKIFPGC
jgi:hypothetical protein